jgi:hypothetical protein
VDRLKLIFQSWSSTLILIAVSLFIAYSPVIFSTRSVNIDAQLIMPLFDQFEGLSGYFHSLFTWQTYDLQPVRDLTLLIDHWAFKSFGLNTQPFQNLIYWCLTIVLVRRLLQIVRPDLTVVSQNLIIFLFSLYPLFCASLSWGIARKHILATMFTIWTTIHFLNYLSHPKKRLILAWALTYALAVLSQPICVLWPLWALLYLSLHGKIRSWVTLIPSFCLMTLIAWANHLYYENSPLFKLYYESKSSSGSELSEKLLGFGHYFYQLLLPYAPATAYELGHWSVLVGLLLFVLFNALYYKFKRLLTPWLTWGAFVFFPLSVVLSNPHIISDAYLLVPAIGMLFLLLAFIQDQQKLEHRLLIVVIPLALVWGTKVFFEARLFTDPWLFAEARNFDRRPNCESALKAATKSYGLRGELSEDVRTYLLTHECQSPKMIGATGAFAFLYLQTYIAYFEKKIETLEKLSSVSYYPRLAYATALFDQGRETEALEQISQVSLISTKIKWSDHYDALIAKHLVPHCETRQLSACLDISKHFTQESHEPYW